MVADFDPRRIAVIGIGQDGYLVPRALAALARESRIFDWLGDHLG